MSIDGHYYSAPYQYAKQQLDARVTAHTVELYSEGQRIASHPRSWLKGRHSTVEAHRPEAHRQVGDWTPERFARWADKIGPSTRQVIEAALRGRRHPEQAYRSCLGILRLGKSYGDARLEAACARALLLGTHRYKSIESILKHGLDGKPFGPPEEPMLPQQHDNVRGPGYYH